MISEMKMVEFVTDLAEIYKSNYSNLELEALYSELRNYSEKNVKDAIQLVVKTHSYRSLPTVHDVIECVKTTRAHDIEPSSQDLENREELFTCEVCKGLGVYIDENKSPGGTEAFCQCSKGRKFKANREEWRSNQRRGA